jgi:WD40 repeat protein/tetratricopeptide (TPR) repeat protein
VAILLATLFTLKALVAGGATVAALRIDEARGDADRNAAAATQAARDEEAAKRDAERDRDAAREALLQALISEAKASRFSRRIGQRFGTLDAVQKAVVLARELKKPPATFDQLRNLAIAALALPDLKADSAWVSFPAYPDDAWAGPLVDPTYRWAAYNHQSGAISIRRVGTGPDDCGEVARVSGVGSEVQLAWSPDGRFLGARYWQSTAMYVRVWRIGDGAPTLVVEAPKGSEGFAFTPDARTVLIVEHEPSGPSKPARTVARFYDLETGRAVRACPLPTGTRAEIALHPSRPELAVNASGIIELIDLNTGARTGSHAPLRGPLVWHPHGELLAGTFGDSVAAWNITRGHQVYNAEHTGGGLFMSLNATGDLMVTNGWAGRLRLWNPYTGHKLFETTGSGVFNPGDRLGTWFPGADVRTVGPLTRVEAAREYRGLPVGVGRPGVRGLNSSIHPDGRLLAVSTQVGFALIDLATGAERAFVPGPDCLDVLFEPDGNLLVTTRTGLYRWPVALAPGEPKRLRVGPPELVPVSAVGTIGCTPDGRVLVSPTGAAGAVTWRRDDPYDTVSFPHMDCRHAAISPDGKLVVTGTWSRRGLHVWEAETGRLLRTLLPDSSRTVPVFSPDGKWLLESRGTRWRVADWTEGPPPPALVGSGRFSPDGRLLAFTGKGFVVLTDAETGRELARFEDPNQDEYNRITFSPDGALLVGVTEDNFCARVWDLRKIRAGLVELGLDWAALPYPPGEAPGAGASPVRIVVAGENLFADAVRGQQTARERAVMALWLNPLDADARLALGAALLSEQRIRDAHAQLSAALALAPDRIGGYRFRATARYRLSEWDGCRADAEAVLARRPNDLLMRSYRGQALAHLGRFADALPELTAVLERYPRDANLLYWRGEAHHALGKPDEAVADWAQAARSADAHTPPASTNGIARRLLLGLPQMRDPKRALELAESANLRHRANAHILNTLGLARYRNALFREAQAALGQSVAFDTNPKRFDGHNLFVLALCRAKLGNGDQARADYRRAVEWTTRQTRLPPQSAEELRELRAEAEGGLHAAGIATDPAPPPREIPKSK